MKYIKSISILLTLSLLVFACKTEIVEKFDEIHLPTGGYMRIVTPYPVTDPTFNVSKKNMSGTKAEMVNEAVTPDKGSGLATYDLEIRFIGATTSAYVPLRSIAASAYAKDATTGYPRHTLVITGAEALAATKLDTSLIKTGQKFEIRATMKLSDGKSFNAANTSVNITGGAFYSSPFRYILNVID